MNIVSSKFIKKNKGEIYNLIFSDEYNWLGEKNGDTTTRYQGRKLKQLSLVLLLVGEELENEKKILCEDQRRTIFFEFLRNLDSPHVEGSIGNSRLELSFISNLFKTL